MSRSERERAVIEEDVGLGAVAGLLAVAGLAVAGKVVAVGGIEAVGVLVAVGRVEKEAVLVAVGVRGRLGDREAAGGVEGGSRIDEANILVSEME